jgi:hypothetical protein
MAGNKKITVGDGIDQAGCYFDAATFVGDVIPDIIQVDGGSRR